MLDEVDVDNSGSIEFDEFERLLSMVNERCSLGQLASDLTAATSAAENTISPSEVVEKVMRALRKPDEPYPLHGAEMAIRYCSPTNRASQLTPQSFAQYAHGTSPSAEIGARLTRYDDVAGTCASRGIRS